MNAEKKELIWTPDPLEGYVLGRVVDVGADTLTVEQEEHPGKVRTRVELRTLLESPPVCNSLL